MQVSIDRDEFNALKVYEQFTVDILAALAIPRDVTGLPKLLEEMQTALAKLHAHSVVQKAGRP